MAKRELLMLAHPYNNKKHGIGGWFLSEKLDGQRCFWDGGISRGMKKSEVYWANCAKDGRYVDTQYATGLWSRYGNVIHAPDSWLEHLPNCPLDGELYVTQDRQKLRTIIARLEPDEDEWDGVEYKVFDSPCLHVVLKEGQIKTTNFKKVLVPDIEIPYVKVRVFRDVYEWLQTRIVHNNPIVSVLEQVPLPMQTDKAEEMIRTQLDKVTDEGGEGVMLRNPDSYWSPNRSHDLVKVKKLSDMEGTVTGYTTGRKTDLGSKLLGKMGALILELDGGIRMELSGFTEVERELECVNDFGGRKADDWATDHPDSELPDCYQARAFPRGSKVTFRYRGKSNDSIPQEARYFRKWEVE